MKFSVSVPFIELMGFELIRFEAGESEIAYIPQPEHLNSFNVVHGGATMTLLDVCLANAARSVQPEMGVVTIEMKTSFLQASVGNLVAKGRLIHRTATMAFTEGTVFDAKGRPCSHATATFKYVKRLPVGASSVHALQPSTNKTTQGAAHLNPTGISTD
jgi:uncharacterized protein (TIGR00369 family)